MQEVGAFNMGRNGIDPRGSKHIKRFDIKN